MAWNLEGTHFQVEANNTADGSIEWNLGIGAPADGELIVWIGAFFANSSRHELGVIEGGTRDWTLIGTWNSFISNSQLFAAYKVADTEDGTIHYTGSGGQDVQRQNAIYIWSGNDAADPIGFAGSINQNSGFLATFSTPLAEVSGESVSATYYATTTSRNHAMIVGFNGEGASVGGLFMSCSYKVGPNNNLVVSDPFVYGSKVGSAGDNWLHPAHYIGEEVTPVVNEKDLILLAREQGFSTVSMAPVGDEEINYLWGRKLAHNSLAATPTPLEWGTFVMEETGSAVFGSYRLGYDQNVWKNIPSVELWQIRGATEAVYAQHAFKHGNTVAGDKPIGLEIDFDITGGINAGTIFFRYYPDLLRTTDTVQVDFTGNQAQFGTWIYRLS